MSNKYWDAAVAWYDNIAREGHENPSPHRRKIAQNYLEHAALEYSADRWEEIFVPTRTVEHPVYKVRWWTQDTITYDGRESVIDTFYRPMKTVEGGLSNASELLSLADWGFSSFHTSYVFRNYAETRAIGFQVADPDGLYVIGTHTAMYWLYDEDARLIGEHVYQIEPSTVEQVTRDEWLSIEDCNRLVEPYIPQGPEVGSSLAFSSAQV